MGLDRSDSGAQAGPQGKPAKRVIDQYLTGTFDGEFGGGSNPAGCPRLPIHLMVSLLYLKNSFNLSDEEAIPAA